VLYYALAVCPFGDGVDGEMMLCLRFLLGQKKNSIDIV
jgi:hypothetical protein